MSQLIVEGGDLNAFGDNLVTKLAEFLNNIHSLKIDAKVDGKRIVVSSKSKPQKSASKSEKKGQKTKKGEGKKKEQNTEASEKSPISKGRLKVYLKRFINKQDLSNDLRVISGGADTFIFHAKPLFEEEPLPEEKA